MVDSSLCVLCWVASFSNINQIHQYLLAVGFYHSIRGKLFNNECSQKKQCSQITYWKRPWMIIRLAKRECIVSLNYFLQRLLTTNNNFLPKSCGNSFKTSIWVSFSFSSNNLDVYNPFGHQNRFLGVDLPKCC